MKKIAAVTGATRGIGRAIAEALAKEGYFVILSAVRSFEQAKMLTEEFSVLGYEADYIKCDISNAEERIHFFRQIKQEYGRLDVMVNNAGVAPKERADILKTTPESFDFVMDVNCKGTFFMCQAAANLMLELKKTLLSNYCPRIINISSVSAYASSVNRGEYCVSKAGVSMITQLFADRLAIEGIPVFEIRPGIILTDMTAQMKKIYQSRIDAGLTPIPRIGTPQDVADCVSAAVSGKLDFAAGQILNADGGFSLRRL